MSEKQMYQDIYEALTENEEFIKWLTLIMQELVEPSIVNYKLLTPKEFNAVDTSKLVSVLALGRFLARGPAVSTFAISDFLDKISMGITATAFKTTETGAEFYPDLLASLGTRLWAIGAIHFFDRNQQKIEYITPEEYLEDEEDI